MLKQDSDSEENLSDNDEEKEFIITPDNELKYYWDFILGL